LITQPEHDRDLRLSEQVRGAVLDAVTTPSSSPGTPASAGVASRAAAIALRASLDHDSSRLSAGEATLLRELLDPMSQP
jgi:hypothetical protein